MADIRHGRIVWVELPDPRGRNPKVRPAVVLSATVDITPDGEIQVAAVTGATTLSPPGECVELPWLGTGHPVTKLNKPCVAVVTWLARVPVSAVHRVGGTVPTPKMLDIIRRVSARAGNSPAVPDPPAPTQNPLPPSDP